jgi:transposase
MSRNHLADVPAERLRAALGEVEGKVPTQRLMVALAAKHGVSQTNLAEWYGIERKTVYNWLTRFESANDVASLVAAAKDDPRPGRPRKLSAAELGELRRTLARPPAEAGYDDQEWTPPLLRAHIEEAYDLTYSTSSCRRLLRELDSTAGGP